LAGGEASVGQREGVECILWLTNHPYARCASLSIRTANRYRYKCIHIPKIYWVNPIYLRYVYALIPISVCCTYTERCAPCMWMISTHISEARSRVLASARGANKSTNTSLHLRHVYTITSTTAMQMLPLLAATSVEQRGP